MVESLFSINSNKLRGTKKTGWLDITESYFGLEKKIPYFVIYGKEDGPNAVITAVIHGDELNGIPLTYKIFNSINPQKFYGNLVMLPVSNIPAFNVQSRYLPDRRDLNRLFPGKPDGSEGSRIANTIWNLCIKDADFGIDLHSASYNRWNFPHIRGNMRLERVRYLAKIFGAEIVIHSQGVLGSLRREATKRNIPFILFEAGQINRFEEEPLEVGLSGIWNILYSLKMVKYQNSKISKTIDTSIYYKKSSWIRATHGGLFVPAVKPGDFIKEGDYLGHIMSLLGEVKDKIKAELSGRILGFNLHPQVVPGRALFHVCHDEKSL